MSFLPQTLRVLGYTAHELGHALGVNQADGAPERSYTNGHTPPILRSPSLIAGDPNSVNGTMLFDGVNTLWAGSMLLDDRFPLGQVFWMNFSCGCSWPKPEASRLKCLPCPGGAVFPHGLPCRSTHRHEVTTPGDRVSSTLQTMCGTVHSGLHTRGCQWVDGLAGAGSLFNLQFRLTRNSISRTIARKPN